MSNEEPEIARREFKHGNVAYGFQWNKTHHKLHGSSEGDLASLWAHLTTIARGQIPESPFRDPFYSRASRLRLKKMTRSGKVAFRKKLMSSGLVRRVIDSELIDLTRGFHRLRNDPSYCSDHSILKEFITHDPKTIAIEVPVWSDRYQLSGHVDLVRFHEKTIEVCDYKPGSLETLKSRFLDSIPQVAAYGEMVAHHLSSTLREALSAPLLPRVNCCIFDTHSCWNFGAEMFVTLLESGSMDEFYV
ncbi:MAG: hypothetical protein EAX95_13630 [Candidatus Thorarchaeota archaeon]|nr:hypothetical protein [Candidatus Thorarchaeota archaeon]